MDPDTAITAVGRAIQLSVAPVFLLSAIGAMLAVMTNRLSRLVDRGRFAESQLVQGTPSDAAHWHHELAVLSRRAKLVNRAITLLTVTALLVCLVIASMFIAASFDIHFARGVAVLFVAAMVSFFVALLVFLREIFVATSTLRLGPPR